MRLIPLATLLLSLATSSAAFASCGWSRIDRDVSFSDTGVWRTSTYRTVSNTLTVANIAGALWEGSESRFGRTMWQALESQVISEGIAAGIKPLVGRDRPSIGNGPCSWGHHGGRSFPSEEATVSAALVTPYILEYGRDKPAAYALLLLPAYVGAGRVKNHAHWQTDVLAGWALGAGIGIWEHGRERPFFVSLLPGGGFVGMRKHF